MVEVSLGYQVAGYPPTVIILQCMTAASRTRCLDAKLYLHNSRLDRRLYMIQGSLRYHVAGYPSTFIFLKFITTACRTRCCPHEALLTQFWFRSSYFYGIEFSRVSYSRLAVNCYNFEIPHRRVAHGVVDTKLYDTIWSRPPYFYGIGFSLVSCSR